MWRVVASHLSCALAVCLLVASPLAHAAPDPKMVFLRAKNAFRYGDHEQAVTLLEGLLSPKVLLKDARDVKEALEILGVASYLTGDKDTAKESFTRLLLLDPETHLDPLVIPPRVIEFFEELRSTLGEKIALARASPGGSAGPKEAKGITRIIHEEVTVDPHPLWLNLLPFGVGQFELDRPGWGWFFLVGEALALGTNVSAWTLVEATRQPDGTHLPDDYRRARDVYQPIQVASLVAFGVLVAWNVVDAMAHWQPETRHHRQWEVDLGGAKDEPPEAPPVPGGEASADAE